MNWEEYEEEVYIYENTKELERNEEDEQTFKPC